MLKVWNCHLYWREKLYLGGCFPWNLKLNFFCSRWLCPVIHDIGKKGPQNTEPNTTASITVSLTVKAIVNSLQPVCLTYFLVFRRKKNLPYFPKQVFVVNVVCMVCVYLSVHMYVDVEVQDTHLHTYIYSIFAYTLIQYFSVIKTRRLRTKCNDWNKLEYVFLIFAIFVLFNINGHNIL